MYTKNVFAKLRCNYSSSRTYTLFTCYQFCLPETEKQNELHFRHRGKDLNRAWPVTSNVSRCVRVTLILIKVVLSKCRKLEISLTIIKDLFQNNDCIELTSAERT